jgi:hypothetical protein
MSEPAETDESYPAPSIGERLRRLSPAVTMLSIASFGSLLVLAWAVLSRSMPIAILVGSAVVTGIVFGLDALAAGIGTYRSGRAGDGRRALLLALLGGAASMVCSLSLAAALIMVLLLNP